MQQAHFTNDLTPVLYKHDEEAGDDPKGKHQRVEALTKIESCLQRHAEGSTNNPPMEMCTTLQALPKLCRVSSINIDLVSYEPQLYLNNLLRKCVQYMTIEDERKMLVNLWHPKSYYNIQTRNQDRYIRRWGMSTSRIVANGNLPTSKREVISTGTCCSFLHPLDVSGRCTRVNRWADNGNITRRSWSRELDSTPIYHGVTCPLTDKTPYLFICPHEQNLHQLLCPKAL
eukprot:284815820_5